MLDHVIRTLHRGVFSFVPSVNPLRGTRGFLRNSGPYGFSKPWETLLEEVKALHGFCTHQADVHLSVIAEVVLKGNRDEQPFCEIFNIVVANQGPSGCWEPQGHGRLAEKMSAS